MKIYVNRSWPETLGTQLPSYNFLNKLYASTGPKILMVDKARDKTLKNQVFKWIQNSGEWYLDPHCTFPKTSEN